MRAESELCVLVAVFHLPAKSLERPLHMYVAQHRRIDYCYEVFIMDRHACPVEHTYHDNP